MKKIINLTPHPVVVLRDDANGEIVGFTGVGPAAKEGRFSLVAEYKPNGKVARAIQKDEPVGDLEINGVSVPLITTVFGNTTNLPDDPQDGLYLVVSIITAQAAKASGRATKDLLITSDPVRDANGKFIGVRKFALV